MKNSELNKIYKFKLHMLNGWITKISQITYLK